MAYTVRGHNAPIAQVIKNYLNKRSGKVSISGEEIRRRYDGLDWKYQKKILYAFLESGRTDREWAYLKLLKNWDDCFVPRIEELWNMYHENKASWIINSFFPVDYLKEHFEELSHGPNYYHVCKRLIGTEGFVVDKSRLDEYYLIRMKRLLGEEISNEELKYLFYLAMYKFGMGIIGFASQHDVEVRESASGYHASMFIIYKWIIEKIIYSVEWQSYCDYERRREYEELIRWFERVSREFYAIVNEMDNIGFLESERKKWHELIPAQYTRVWDGFDLIDNSKFLYEYWLEHKNDVRD